LAHADVQAERAVGDQGSDTRDQVSLGVLEELAGYHLRRASYVFGADFARTLDHFGMRQVPFAILAVIDANPGINQAGIGKLLGIKRANMVALVNDLERRELVERATDPRDRRAFGLSLKPGGKTLLIECHARILEHEERLLTGFSAAERTLLKALLARIAAQAG
jgi:DNA-binding MarR family transcriptional regulator